MNHSISINDGNIFVETNGIGEAVVLIHGTASYHFCWRYVSDSLADKYHVIIPDLLGAGYSDKPREKDYSKAAHAKRVIEVLSSLDVKKVHLVGHSMGGEVAVHIAIQAPGLVKSLVLIAPDGFRKGVNSFIRSLAKKRWLAGLFKSALKRQYKHKVMARTLGLPHEKITAELLDGWTKPYSDPDLPYIITKTLADDDTGVIANEVYQLKMPILLIHGTKDKLVPPHVFTSYKAALPNMKVEVYEDFGHVLMEECPEKLAKSIQGFIESIVS